MGERDASFFFFFAGRHPDGFAHSAIIPTDLGQSRELYRRRQSAARADPGRVGGAARHHGPIP